MEDGIGGYWRAEWCEAMLPFQLESLVWYNATERLLDILAVDCVDVGSKTFSSRTGTNKFWTNSPDVWFGWQLIFAQVYPNTLVNTYKDRTQFNFQLSLCKPNQSFFLICIPCLSC
jgi:hypothetical protein